MAYQIKGKKGQMTIWIIVALALVGAIIIFFLFRGTREPILDQSVGENPKSFIADCVKRNVNDVVDEMLIHGGLANPEHVKMHNGININYLCYNSGNYNPCINEHPMLINEMEKEIKNYIEPKIEECFQNYKIEIGKRQIEIELKPMLLSVSLGSGKVFVDIERDVAIKQRGESYNLNDFDSEVSSPIYDLGNIAIEIANQEAEYCYFENVGYGILYPKFKILRNALSDSSVIYIIEEKRSEKKMNIAIRSCAIPAGL